MDKRELNYKIKEICHDFQCSDQPVREMAEWMREQLGWQLIAKNKHPYPDWGDNDYVALCKNNKLRLFIGFCDENHDGIVSQYFYWNDDWEEPVDFDEVIAWIELPSFSH